jgi:hypothetical protein
MSQRRPREKSAGHLEFIRQLPCLICGDDSGTTEAAHIRYSDSRVAKINSGLQAKPHDRYTAPLCGRHHREQHQHKEREWWIEKGIDPIFYALALWGCSGDHQTGSDIIRARLETMQ